MDAVADTFQDVDDLLWKCSHRFVNRYGGALDEARSSANESFLIAYRDWNPSSTMSFTSYVYMVVWNRFRDEARRFAVRRGREPLHEDVDGLEVVEPTPNNWRTRSISNDAEDIVDLICEPEFRDFQVRMKRQRSVPRLQFVKEFLNSEWGWTHERIEAACDEIHSVLSQRK